MSQELISHVPDRRCGTRRDVLRCGGVVVLGTVRGGGKGCAGQGFRRILVTEPDHPYVGAWWPPGHGLGYEHGFTHQVVDLVRNIADHTQPRPSFADGLAVQRVLGAVAASAAAGSSWVSID